MMVQQPGQQGSPPPAGFDPSAPVMERNTEIAEVSTSQIGDAVFGFPLGFEEASFDDLMKAWAASARPTPSVGTSGV